MADDERRAKIEAVRDAIREYAPTGTTSRMLAERIVSALDAVRDARGDDECRMCGGTGCILSGLQYLKCETCGGSGLVARSPQDEDYARWSTDAGWARGDDRAGQPSPQGEDHELVGALTDADERDGQKAAGGAGPSEPSPQDEDHEAGIVEVHLSDCCLWPKMHTRGGDGSPGEPCWAVCEKCGQDCEPVPFSRVSPSRDDEAARLRNEHEFALSLLRATADELARVGAELEAARSPQNEGHEAGIEAAYDAADACFPSSAQGRWLRPAVEAAVAAYLSRVSPSRDGTVAVEDVAEWLRTTSANPHDPWGVYRKFLAEFAAPASTGDRAPDEDPPA